jgi:hypothetical protein
MVRKDLQPRQSLMKERVKEIFHALGVIANVAEFRKDFG